MSVAGCYQPIKTISVQPTQSNRILTIGVVIIAVAAVIVVIYLAVTAFRRVIRQKRTGRIVVNSKGGQNISTPFTNAYIRTTDGYWLDDGEHQVGFSSMPQQRWTFDGLVLTNQTTYNSLYSLANSYPTLLPIPAAASGRVGFLWVFNGVSLSTSASAGENPVVVVTDVNSRLQLVQTNPLQIPQGAVLEIVL